MKDRRLIKYSHPMSDPVIIALIVAVPSTISAVLAGIAVILGAKNKTHIAQAQGAIEELHGAVNGRMSDLIATTKAASEAFGRLEEQSDIRERATPHTDPANL